MSGEGIVRDYLAGDTWAQICARYKVGRATVQKHLRTAGIGPSRRPHAGHHRSGDLIEDVEWLLADDATLSSAIDRLGVKHDSLWRALRRAGRIDLWDALMDRDARALKSQAARQPDLRARPTPSSGRDGTAT